MEEEMHLRGAETSRMEEEMHLGGAETSRMEEEMRLGGAEPRDAPLFPLFDTSYHHICSSV